MQRTIQLREPQQERARQTREKLVQAGKKLLGARGYAATTAAAVTQEAVMSKGIFYSYFRNKDELLMEIAREQLEDQKNRLIRLLKPLDPDDDLDEQVRARVRDVVILVADHHRSDPRLHATISERRHADGSFDAFCRDYERLQLRHVALFLESMDFPGDAEATAFILYNMIEGAVHSHILQESLVNDERFFGTLIDAISGMLLRRA